MLPHLTVLADHSRQHTSATGPGTTVPGDLELLQVRLLTAQLLVLQVALLAVRVLVDVARDSTVVGF